MAPDNLIRFLFPGISVQARDQFGISARENGNREHLGEPLSRRRTSRAASLDGRCLPDKLRRPKAQADCLRPSRLGVVFVSFASRRFWFGCDRNLNVSTLFEFHIIAVFVS